MQAGGTKGTPDKNRTKEHRRGGEATRNAKHEAAKKRKKWRDAFVNALLYNLPSLKDAAFDKKKLHYSYKDLVMIIAVNGVYFQISPLLLLFPLGVGAVAVYKDMKNKKLRLNKTEH